VDAAVVTVAGNLNYGRTCPPYIIEPIVPTPLALFGVPFGLTTTVEVALLSADSREALGETHGRFSPYSRKHVDDHITERLDEILETANMSHPCGDPVPPPFTKRFAMTSVDGGCTSRELRIHVGKFPQILRRFPHLEAGVLCPLRPSPQPPRT
jgi:hypothetical protein